MESVWAGEHVVLPSPRVPPSPMNATEPVLDPLLALTWAAAATTRLRGVAMTARIPSHRKSQTAAPHPLAARHHAEPPATQG